MYEGHVEIIEDYLPEDGSSPLKKPEPVQVDSEAEVPAEESKEKKTIIGPKNNKINFDRILYATDYDDNEVLGYSTLMIKNIPIKFAQNELQKLID